jgi:hypothetical protein
MAEAAPPGFLMTAEQHRGRAAQLRASGTAEGLMLAQQHENVARMMEHRQAREQEVARETR